MLYYPYEIIVFRDYSERGETVRRKLFIDTDSFLFIGRQGYVHGNTILNKL